MSSSVKRRFSVFAAVSQPRAWLPLTGALLGLSAALGACSDEFGSCFETHTCPNNANEGGAGGEGAAAAGAGGSDAGGAAGADARGIVLTIESVTPADQALSVERDALVQVVFSEEVEASTLDGDSFRILGARGAIPGMIEVDGAVVSFTPEAPWDLLAEYTVELSTALVGTSGAALEEPASFVFRIRDGALTKPRRLWSKSSVNLTVEGSRRGHVVVHWQEDAIPKNVLFTLYDPISQSWSAPGPVEDEADQDYPSACAALNDAGDVFAIVGSNSYLWNRAVGGTWGTAKPTSRADLGSCALGDDGTALATWRQSPGTGFDYYAAILSPDDQWSEPELLQSQAVASDAIRYKNGFLAFHAREDESRRLYSRVYDPNAGWLAAKAVTPAGTDYNYWSLDAYGDVAMLTWIGDNGTARASLFDGSAWSSEELAPAASGTRAAVGANRHLAAWNYDSNAYVARNNLDSGWEDPVKLGSAYVEPIWGPAVAIDPSGNSFAVWPGGGSSIFWRRMPAECDAWSDVQEIRDQDPYGVDAKVDDSGNVMIVWSNALGVWASRFE